MKTKLKKILKKVSSSQKDKTEVKDISVDTSDSSDDPSKDILLEDLVLRRIKNDAMARWSTHAPSPFEMEEEISSQSKARRSRANISSNSQRLQRSDITNTGSGNTLDDKGPTTRRTPRPTRSMNERFTSSLKDPNAIESPEKSTRTRSRKAVEGSRRNRSSLTPTPGCRGRRTVKNISSNSPIEKNSTRSRTRSSVSPKPLTADDMDRPMKRSSSPKRLEGGGTGKRPGVRRTRSLERPNTDKRSSNRRTHSVARSDATKDDEQDKQPTTQVQGELKRISSGTVPAEVMGAYWQRDDDDDEEADKQNDNNDESGKKKKQKERRKLRRHKSVDSEDCVRPVRRVQSGNRLDLGLTRTKEDAVKPVRRVQSGNRLDLTGTQSEAWEARASKRRTTRSPRRTKSSD